MHCNAVTVSGVVIDWTFTLGGVYVRVHAYSLIIAALRKSCVKFCLNRVIILRAKFSRYMVYMHDKAGCVFTDSRHL